MILPPDAAAYETRGHSDATDARAFDPPDRSKGNPARAAYRAGFVAGHAAHVARRLERGFPWPPRE